MSKDAVNTAQAVAVLIPVIAALLVADWFAVRRRVSQETDKELSQPTK